MKILVFILFLITCSSLSAQNLISNPSFEDIDSCYGQPAGIGFDVFEWSGCTGWSCPTNGSSDLWCNNPIIGGIVPPNISSVGFQNAFHGNNFAGILVFDDINFNYREYLSGKLITKLKPKMFYKFTCRINLATFYLNNTSCFGVSFTKGAPFQNDVFKLNIQPQIKNDDTSFITDTVEWLNFSETFYCDDEYEYFTLGCFEVFENLNFLYPYDTTGIDTLGGAGTYLFIDSLSLTESAGYVEIPNVFTPQSDGVNDNWQPRIYNLGQWECLILNRWGYEIAQLNDVNSFWNGKDKENKDLSDGVYFYKLKIKNYPEISYSGFIHLIR